MVCGQHAVLGHMGNFTKAKTSVVCRNKTVPPLQGMQDTAHLQQHAFASHAARPKPMVERPSSSVMSDAIEAVYGRQEVMEALPVEAFQCQLWEPAKSVLALEPGKFCAV